MKKVYLIGIGYRPFDKRAKEITLNSKVILATNRLFEIFKGYEEFEAIRDNIRVINNMDEMLDYIKCQNCDVTVLASGDPMFFGIGRRAMEELGRDTIEVIPDLSAIQIAFSRIKETWDDALLLSLHGEPDPKKGKPYTISDLPSLLQHHHKIAVLTDRNNTPSKIAEILKCSLLTVHCPLVIYVCEKLGAVDERIIKGSPEELLKVSFAEPNIVIIIS
ncbi:MAG: precorrin-6y C5,15-methyltransferase (decarboxylating) subunit CbiE [bacterium]